MSKRRIVLKDEDIPKDIENLQDEVQKKDIELMIQNIQKWQEQDEYEDRIKQLETENKNLKTQIQDLKAIYSKNLKTFNDLMVKKNLKIKELERMVKNG
uniref:hypothetical protein n=1 Tax=Eubacterium sp. TaxID=142586 RepID=UPI004026F896